MRRYPYIDRDVSWMYFNRRLLKEASRYDIPLLERLNYLGIYANNLDEFFKVRVANLRRMQDLNLEITASTRAEASISLAKIEQLNRNYDIEFYSIWENIKLELEKENIKIVDDKNLSEEQKDEIISFYMEKLNGILYPIFIDSKSFHADQHLKESLYLIVKASHGKEYGISSNISIIEIPVKDTERFIRLKDRNNQKYIIFIEDIVRFCLPLIYSGMDYFDFEANAFILTKNAELNFEADPQASTMQKVRLGLQKRKTAMPIRFIYDRSMSKDVFDSLISHISNQQKYTLLESDIYLDMKDLIAFPSCDRFDLKYKEQKPLILKNLKNPDSILSEIQKKDIGIHFPYFSFEHFLRVLREAAISREVSSIKVSIYRLAQNSKVVKALIAAAQNGKKVTAIVELMARFDEASNINWSKKMQEAGINIIFGNEKLKIHSKIVHISSKNGDISCVGTGNMHEGTAKIYTDYMIMTANPDICREVSQVFDFIDKPFYNYKFNTLIVSPNDMRKKIYDLINREIKLAKSGKEAFIKIKINHIVDEGLVKKLYEASRAGVKLDLCVRGNCSIVPNKEKFSKNININAIIDRYLEHSRIYIFSNDGDPLYFVGSSDWMQRNLDRRIEVMMPVFDKDIQKELYHIVEAGLNDTSQGHFVNINDGNPKREYLDKSKLYRSQEALYAEYRKSNDI